jgi:hypothetical protein
MVLVNYKIDAQFFSMYLFRFSTFFEQPRAHHQENQLYQHSMWYMSICGGDHFVCRSDRNFPTCTRGISRDLQAYTRPMPRTGTRPLPFITYQSINVQSTSYTASITVCGKKFRITQCFHLPRQLAVKNSGALSGFEFI